VSFERTVAEDQSQRALSRLRCHLCRQPVKDGLFLFDPVTNRGAWREGRYQLVADHSEAHRRVCVGQQSLDLSA
jgi:hypothetical protein